MSFESPESHKGEDLPTQLGHFLDERIQKGNFHLEPGETIETVLTRAELIRALFVELPAFTHKLLVAYRALLTEHGVTEEQTGKLTCLIVGGNIHKETALKSSSDVDLVIATEKPFSPYRFDNPSTAEDPISIETYESVTEKLWEVVNNELIPELNIALSEYFKRPIDIGNLESPEGGLIEIKGYGEQRADEVAHSLLLSVEP